MRPWAAAIGLILIYWKQITADRKVFPWLTLAAAIGGALDGFGSPSFRLSAIAEESAEFAAGTFAVTAMRLRLASRQMTGVARERDRVALPKSLAACDNC